jgi:cysteine-rich repeat protein
MNMELRPLALAVAVASFACMPGGSDEAETTGDEVGAPICGDGKLGPPEACDDGNTQPGDGCSAACELSGTPTQCITLMSGDGKSGADQVDVLLPSSDSFVAAGSLSTGEQSVAWVGEWSARGEQSWLTTMAPEDGGALLRDVTTDGSTGYWVALSTWAAADLEELEELAHLDEIGSVLERTSFPDASLRRVRWIDGRLWVAGSRQAGQHAYQTDLWLAFLENGELETVMLEDHLGFGDSIGAMEVLGDRVLVVATLGTTSGVETDFMQEPTSEVIVITLDLEGNELHREALDTGSLETPRANAVRGVGDRWVVAGYAPPVQAVLRRPQIWLTNAESNWMWDSFSVFGPQPGSDPQGGASVGGIVTVDTGVVLAGGSYTGPGPTAGLELTGWLMEFDHAGQLVWEHHTTDPSESWYRETAMAIDASGRIRTAGVGRTDAVSSTLRSCIMER